MITEEIWYAAAGEIALALALVILASLVYSISSKIGTEIAEASTLRSDVLSQKDDAKYVEELQLREALLVSLLSFETTSLSSLLQDNKIVFVRCEICFEEKEYSQMFRNSTCSHFFCYECTSKHATTKIQERNNAITCPGLNCKSTLDFNNLRQIIPKDVLIKWDDLLCESMILESHKLSCPFQDCSELLINDDSGITKIDCPACRRLFCAVCRVPWHSEFSCKEFEALNKKKRGTKGDEMVVALAKKKKWKKCPNCKFFVEKTQGCAHIICRCRYEFCYNCGGMWNSTSCTCR